MIYRLWNFAKRHKKKLLGSAFFFGGAYVGWRVLKPRVMDYMIQRLLKQVEGGDMLKELMAGLEDPEELKAKQRAKFNHNQQVADSYAKKSLSALVHERLKNCFAVDERSQALAQAKTKEAKLKCIEDLQVECFSRSMSALYSMHLLLLLHRVEFNIVGREMQSSSGSDGKIEDCEDSEVYTAFFENVASYVQGDGLPQICDAMREAVKARWSAESMAPQTKVSNGSLRSFLLSVCTAADVSLLEGGKAPTTLLPERLDVSAAPKVKKLMDETRDYIESPQFLSVFRSVVADALTHFVNSLGEDLSEPARGAPLPREGSVAIAKLGGECVQRSQVMFAPGDTAGYVRRFGDGDLVAKLCEALYFEEGQM